VVFLIALAVLVVLVFAPRARRIVFSTLSSIFTILGSLLFLTWLTGSRRKRGW